MPFERIVNKPATQIGEIELTFRTVLARDGSVSPLQVTVRATALAADRVEVDHRAVNALQHNLLTQTQINQATALLTALRTKAATEILP